MTWITLKKITKFRGWWRIVGPTDSDVGDCWWLFSISCSLVILICCVSVRTENCWQHHDKGLIQTTPSIQQTLVPVLNTWNHVAIVCACSVRGLGGSEVFPTHFPNPICVWTKLEGILGLEYCVKTTQDVILPNAHVLLKLFEPVFCRIVLRSHLPISVTSIITVLLQKLGKSCISFALEVSLFLHE